MQDKDTGTKRVAIVGPAGTSSSMKAALTLLATTHNLEFIEATSQQLITKMDIDWDLTEALREMAKHMRAKEVQQVERYTLCLNRRADEEIPWELKPEHGAHLNFEENKKLRTKGSRSKQRRKW